MEGASPESGGSVQKRSQNGQAGNASRRIRRGPGSGNDPGTQSGVRADGGTIGGRPSGVPAGNPRQEALQETLPGLGPVLPRAPSHGAQPGQPRDPTFE